MQRFDIEAGADDGPEPPVPRPIDQEPRVVGGPEQDEGALNFRSEMTVGEPRAVVLSRQERLDPVDLVSPAPQFGYLGNPLASHLLDDLLILHAEVNAVGEPLGPAGQDGQRGRFVRPLLLVDQHWHLIELRAGLADASDPGDENESANRLDVLVVVTLRPSANAAVLE